MPAILQSLKTKFEFVLICITLLGMISTGIYVYSSQTLQLNSHEKKILAIETKDEKQDTEAQALTTVINATVIPTLNAQRNEIISHTSRLDTMEKNARADREILIEIRTDLKWMRERMDSR